MFDAEDCVIGSVLLTSGVCVDDLAITPEDFYDPHKGRLYGLMKSMRAEGKPVDVVTVVNDVRFRELKFNGNNLHDFCSVTPTSASVDYYALQVVEKATRRKVALAASQIASMALESDISLLTDRSRKLIDDALGQSKSKVVFVGEEIGATYELMSEEPNFYPTPWARLSQAIGGFRRGALYVVGARPGKGKSVVGLQSAIELAKYGNVAFSSLEMSRTEIHKRIISSQASIPMDLVMNNSLHRQDWEQIAVTRNLLAPKIAIDDRANVTIGDIRAHARAVAREGHLSGVVVDYLQLMSSPDTRPRHEVVADFSRQLKLLARDLDVPVIALSQLNRQSEGRQDKKPSLGDLRESGAIEQDADVVILLHQEDESEMLMDVAKNRHGAPSLVKLYWEGHYARITNREE